MTDSAYRSVSIDEIDGLNETISTVVEASIEAASKASSGGRKIDDQQELTERIAYVATELEACKALGEETIEGFIVDSRIH